MFLYGVLRIHYLWGLFYNHVTLSNFSFWVDFSLYSFPILFFTFIFHHLLFFYHFLQKNQIYHLSISSSKFNGTFLNMCASSMCRFIQYIPHAIPPGSLHWQHHYNVNMLWSFLSLSITQTVYTIKAKDSPCYQFVSFGCKPNYVGQ